MNESKMNGEEFFNDLILAFPTLKDKILEGASYENHSRMETFARYTMEQIKLRNWDELKKCFEFQESRIELIDSELINALTVSYCESLLLGELSQQMNDIVPRMGTKLQKHYKEYEDYYNDLVKKWREREGNKT
jgi:hypothetical protein